MPIVITQEAQARSSTIGGQHRDMLKVVKFYSLHMGLGNTRLLVEDSMKFLPPYVETGSGPALVFAHGTLMDYTMFAPQQSGLPESYRKIAYNHRSRTELGQQPFTLDQLADDCVALLDALRIEKCVLAGMSMGGFMALNFALRYQQRLAGVVFIAAFPGAYTDELRTQFRAEFGKLDCDGNVPSAWAEWAAPLCFGATTLEKNRKLVDHWVSRWTALPARGVYHEGDCWIDKPDLLAQSAEIHVPALILHGEEDTVVPLTWTTPLMDYLPNGRLEVIPRAGHTVNCENVASANRALSRFLADVYRS